MSILPIPKVTDWSSRQKVDETSGPQYALSSIRLGHCTTESSDHLNISPHNCSNPEESVEHDESNLPCSEHSGVSENNQPNIPART